MPPFKSAPIAVFTLALLLTSLLSLTQLPAAQTRDEEWPDLELAGGRIKIAYIVSLYYLSPVLATIKHAGANDQKLIAIVNNLKLTVSNDVTFYPSAWAEQKFVSIDAGYVWTKQELFWLAAMQSLRHPATAATVRSAFTQYHAQCLETRHLGQPWPWVSVGKTGERRHFGNIQQAFPDFPPIEQEAIQDESRRIGRQFMAFVVLHEIGHHYLGHVGKKVSPDEARTMEIHADSWAFHVLASLGYSLADVRLMFDLETKAEAERLASGYRVPPTHPRWETRLDRLDWLLPQIPVSHGDIVRLIGVAPIETGGGLRYMKVALEFPRDPAAAGSMLSSLNLNDRAEDLTGVVTHRESTTYLFFREYSVGGGARYVIRIEDVLSHAPRATFEEIIPGQPNSSRVRVLLLRPDFSLDPVTSLVGRRSLRSERWRVTEALRRAAVPVHLQADASNAFFATERKLETAVADWVMGEMPESEFDAKWDKLIKERWANLEKILGRTIYQRFREAYFALRFDDISY